ncbi:MAG: NAD-dependent epimerase/dehydratase family protein, partial [Chloroflexi bacterium]|nr:NAD-dependent epimerase/dehydratase family protein [Chloroflexota bacterium]
MNGWRFVWHDMSGVTADDGSVVPIWNTPAARPRPHHGDPGSLAGSDRPEAILRSMLQRSTISHQPRLVVVTGGAGFIGSNLVRAREARGDRVRVIDSGEVAGYDNLAGTAAELVSSDIADITPSTLSGADAVVHLAARAGIVTSLVDPLGDLRINVEGTLAVLEGARSAGVPRLLFASSGAAVGHAELPLSERALPRPLSPYGAGKLA